MTALILVLGVLAAAVGVLYVGVIIRGTVRASPRRPAEEFPAETTTPHGALRLYADAISRQDLERMVALRDFAHDAGTMLKRTHPSLAADAELLDQTRITLEEAFRVEWRTREWPDLTDARIFYGDALAVGPTAVFIRERVVLPGQRAEDSVVYLVRTGGHWRLVYEA